MLDFHNCCCSLPIHLFASLCCFVHAHLLQHCFQVFPSQILNCGVASRITFSSVQFDLSFCSRIFFCLMTTYLLYKSTNKGKCLRTLWAQRQLVHWQVGRKPVLTGVDSKTRLDKGHLIQRLPWLSWASLDCWTNVTKNPSFFLLSFVICWWLVCTSGCQGFLCWEGMLMPGVLSFICSSIHTFFCVLHFAFSINRLVTLRAPYLLCL